MSQYERLAREAQDEKIAQLLMEAEKKKIEEERLAIQKDLEFARSLQEEDQADRVKADRARQQRIAEEGRAKAAEVEHKRILLEQQRALQEQQRRAQIEAAKSLEARDIEFARKLHEEERKKKQLEDDEDLARRLQSQLNIQPVRYVPPAPIVSYIPPAPVYANINANNVVNAHTQQIHRQYCGCAKTNSWDSNHVYKIHSAHCSCVHPFVGTYSNEGAVHQHTRNCCRKNHVHNISCHCSYRTHGHTQACCSKYHVHSIYCHCTHK